MVTVRKQLRSGLLTFRLATFSTPDFHSHLGKPALNRVIGGGRCLLPFPIMSILRGVYFVDHPNKYTFPPNRYRWTAQHII